MLGTITNCGAILAGSIIGTTLHKGIKEQYQQTMMNGLGLAALETLQKLCQRANILYYLYSAWLPEDSLELY